MPMVTISRTRRIIAHSDSVGVATGPGPTAPARPQGVTTFESSVTVPLRARARPCRLALVAMVMLVSARMLPCIALKVPIDAELPTCQKTSHAEAPLIRATIDAPGPDAVVSAVVWIT